MALTAPPATRRVLLLGLDAASWSRIRQLADAGRMPALAGLLRRGRSGVLRSPADRFAGGVWPCFYLGRPVSAHGIYHSKLWRPDAMRIEVPDERWLGARPFWEGIGEAGRRLCILDVPMLLGRPRALNGVHLAGWGTHDLIAAGSWPAGLWRDLVARHGPPAMPAERFGRQDAASLAALHRELLRATGQLGQVARDLLARAPWDLACVVLGATHRAGHYLWDLSQIDPDGLPAERRARLEVALDDVHAAVDREIGAILPTLDDRTVVIAFAVHGMAANPGWSDLLPDLLDALEAAEQGRPPDRGLAYRLKRLVPMHLAGAVLRRLPVGVTQRLVPLWSAGMRDWSRTRSFALPMDHAGYLRINLEGRERSGIVAPGAGYRAELDRLRARLSTLRDAADGRPLVAELVEAWADAAPGSEGRDLLPDLVVLWGDRCARDVREVGCDAVPGFRYRVPPLLPSGRSGNHTAIGWMVAAGPGIVAGAIEDGHAIEDLAPTVRALLDLPPDPALPGRAVASVAGT